MNAASRPTDLVERIGRGDGIVDHTTGDVEHQSNTMDIRKVLSNHPPRRSHMSRNH